jgi:dihydrofolate reductase
MRRIRYAVAASLDGYIAGPNGEADWIIMDPEIDFNSYFEQFDTVLLGRRTFETIASAGNAAMPGMKTVVFSRTLRQKDYPSVMIVAEKAEETLETLRQQSGKDIWLFGGGSLFGSLLDANLVDTIEIAVIPVLLGAGIPLVESPAKVTKLNLTRHKIYKSGIVSLECAIQ